MKQNHEIRFKVSKEQHDLIKKKSEEAHMNLKDLILHLILRVKIIQGE